MSPHPGEVWLADLGLAAKTRPIVIVSRHDPEAPRALAIYVPLTTQNRGSKYEVVLPQLRFLRDASVANVPRPRISAVDTARTQSRRPTTRGAGTNPRGCHIRLRSCLSNT